MSAKPCYRKVITKEVVRALLHYDPETGALTWKPRSGKWCKDDRSRKSWNTRHAGKLAFTSTDSLGYLQGQLLANQLRAHRVIWLWMTGEWPDQVDHINHIRTDNRWDNLREVSVAENNRNCRLHKNNTSGVSGVFWNKRRCLWHAYIRMHGSIKYLGTFEDFDDAVLVRKTYEKRLGFHDNHGDAA